MLGTTQARHRRWEDGVVCFATDGRSEPRTFGALWIGCMHYEQVTNPPFMDKIISFLEAIENTL